jgi:hypothetical protein
VLCWRNATVGAGPGEGWSIVPGTMDARLEGTNESNVVLTWIFTTPADGAAGVDFSYRAGAVDCLPPPPPTPPPLAPPPSPPLLPSLPPISPTPSSPPLPQQPTPPPPSPLLKLPATAATITVAVVAAGSISDFTPNVQLGLRAKVAAEVGVTTDAVVLTVSAASVILTFDIALPASIEPLTAIAALDARLSSTGAASAFLSSTSVAVNVESVHEVPALRSAAPPSPSGSSETITVAAIIVALAVLGIAAGVCLHVRPRAPKPSRRFTGLIPAPRGNAFNSVVMARGTPSSGGVLTISPHNEALSVSI